LTGTPTISIIRLCDFADSEDRYAATVYLRASIPLFLLMICSARGEPIVLSVGGGPAVSYAGSASTIIAASAPATILITQTSSGLPLIGEGPSLIKSLDFGPLGGGQGIFDPASASYSYEAFGFGPPSAGAFCGGAFVGNNPVLLGSFSCTEAIGPGLYSFNISLQVGPDIMFSMPTSGSIEGTVTLISGGLIEVVPEPASFVLSTAGLGLFFIAAAGLRGRQKAARRASQRGGLVVVGAAVAGLTPVGILGTDVRDT
jgi:hypothetical protein